ncbi:MAG: hypothetical protein OXT07_04275, partial [bacterium]|nr:hypothetical protein [bacterium]
MTLSVLLGGGAAFEDGSGLGYFEFDVVVTAPASTTQDLHYLLCFGGTAVLDRDGTLSAGEDFQVLSSVGTVQKVWGTGDGDGCVKAVNTQGSFSGPRIRQGGVTALRVRVFADEVDEGAETITVTLREDTRMPVNPAFSAAASGVRLPSDVVVSSAGNPFTVTVNDGPDPLAAGCATQNWDGSFAVPADWPLAPEGLEPWSLFRLLFVTAGEYTPPGGVVGVSVLDEVVRDEARDGHASLGAGCAGLFSLLGSTLGTSARENTSTRASDTGASV